MGSSKPNWSSPCLASRQTPNRYGWFICRWEAENDTGYTEQKSELDSAYPLHACWWVVLLASALRKTARAKAEPTQWGALHLWECMCLVKFYLLSLLLSVTSQRPLFPDSGASVKIFKNFGQFQLGLLEDWRRFWNLRFPGVLGE